MGFGCTHWAAGDRAARDRGAAGSGRALSRTRAATGRFAPAFSGIGSSRGYHLPGASSPAGGTIGRVAGAWAAVGRLGLLSRALPIGEADAATLPIPAAIAAHRTVSEIRELLGSGGFVRRCLPTRREEDCCRTLTAPSRPGATGAVT
nr:hypothetical protein Ade03nite_15750 [Actinoplanes derwentensis]